MTKRPAANGALQTAGPVDVAVSVPESTRDPVEAHLRLLMAQCDDIPLLDEVDDEFATPCAVAAIARAALAWHLDGKPEAIAERLKQELREQNWLCAWRLRRLSGDLSEAADWSARSRLTPIAELKRLRRYGVAS